MEPHSPSSSRPGPASGRGAVPGRADAARAAQGRPAAARRPEAARRADADLTALGLDAAAGEVYRLVLRQGTTTAAAVAATGLDEATVAGSLARLRTLGLVVRRSEGDEHDAVDPRVAVAAALATRERALGAVRAGVPALAALFDRSRDASPSPSSELVTGAAAVGDRYSRLETDVEEEFLAFDRPPYVVSADGGHRQRAALLRGVRWRAVYTASSFRDPGRWQGVRRLGDDGEEARVVHDLPVKMVVADRRTALVALTLEPGGAEALVTSSPPLVAALVDLFERYWRTGAAVQALSAPTEAWAAVAEALAGAAGGVGGGAGDGGAVGTERPAATSPTGTGPGRGDGGGVASAFDRDALVLLAAGATDEAMAQQLGVSTRTLRRRLRVLFDELGASNRFHAGVQAARRGWI